MTVPVPEGPLRVGALELDGRRGRAALAARPLALSPSEFRLLARLMERAGRPVTRAALAVAVWGSARGVHSMAGVLGGLRRALRAGAAAAGAAPPIIESVAAGVYRLVP